MIKTACSLLLITFFSLACKAQSRDLVIIVKSSITNEAPLEPVILTALRKDIYAESNSQGIVELKDLIIGETYDFKFIAFGYDELNESVLISDQNDSLFFTLNAECSYSSHKAKTDIKSGRPQLLLIGSIAPVMNSEVDNQFEKQFNIKYYDFGCSPPALECVWSYNKEVFIFLDSTYGEPWRKKVRLDVIGLE